MSDDIFKLPYDSSIVDELAETLHDFREFVNDNVCVWYRGAGNTNPMWGRVATVLDKHGKNSIPEKVVAEKAEGQNPGWARKYFRFDPAYHPASRDEGEATRLAAEYRNVYEWFNMLNGSGFRMPQRFPGAKTGNPWIDRRIPCDHVWRTTGLIDRCIKCGEERA